MNDSEKRVFSVYKGEKNGKLVYVGTTVQKPEDRFRWHKYNGKDLNFEVLFQFDTAQEMLDKEFELIKKYNPRLNKITHRKQNYNVYLTVSELESRKSNKEWCQCCLRRRVNKGYSVCYFCQRGK